MLKNKNINQGFQRPKPVLMIPIRRCGSHALRLRLNFSPDFYSPCPLNIVDFMPLVELYGELSNDYTYFQLVIDLIGLQTASVVKWDNVVLDPVSVFEVVKERPRNVHSIVWEMLFQAGQKHQAKIVMDKSLDNVHYADELLSLFDDMLFLNVVRDPRAQVSSINRAIIHDFDSLLNTITWVKAHDAAKALAEKYPDKVLTVRYEDFLSNQETVIRKICEFFGIEFLTSMLDVSASQEAQKLSVLSALWATNICPPIPAYIDKFKKCLSIEEIELIETLAGNHMDYYGYEKLTKARANITEEMIERAKERNEFKKREAWMNLKETGTYDYQLRRWRRDYLNMVKERLQQNKTEVLSGLNNNIQQSA